MPTRAQSPGVLAAAIAHAMMTGATYGATITVDSASDDGSGCTLRKALQAANDDSQLEGCDEGDGQDTIVFAPALYGATIALTAGRLNISTALDIIGPGPTNLTITANGGSQIFSISNDTVTTASVGLTGLTIEGGSANFAGGGIFNEEDLTLNDCIISNNLAGSGAGLFSRLGSATVTNTSFSANVASTSGGAIQNEASMSLSDSTISGNSASFSGAGIYNNGTLFIHSTQVTSNTASSSGSPLLRGGGIFNSQYGALDMRFSQVTGNRAGNGGGLFNAGELTVRHSALSANFGYNGGGIQIRDGIATLTDTQISDHTEGGRGGGIHLFEGQLHIVGSTLSGNSVLNDGGAVYHDRGTLKINRTTFQHNTARVGGGISTRGSGSFGPALADINYSTFANNTATYRGGGLYASNNDRLTIRNSTFSGNQAVEIGGGMELLGGGTSTLTNTTITGNSAGIYGGGLANGLLTITDLVNTIIANSVDGGDCIAVDNDDIQHVNDLIEDGGCPSPVGNPTLIVDPQLGPLADNGGPTLTHALLPDSPAIDAGHINSCNLSDPSRDQRGAPRSVDGNNDGQTACDIGAVEFGSDPPPDEIFSDGFE